MKFSGTQQSTYEVRVSSFEGPLELLLSLIEKRKLFINDISLSEVADDYLRTITEFTNFPIHDVSGFLQVATTLVLIKSKSLLPELPLTDDEEGDIENLEDRLRQYARMKELGERLLEIYGKRRSYGKKGRQREPVVFSPDQKTNIESIVRYAGVLLQNFPKKDREAIARIGKTIRLEDVMKSLLERVSRTLRVKFQDISHSSHTEKREVIVHFIAMLELVKSGSITATQQNLFDDIHMEPLDLGTPTYN